MTTPSLLALTRIVPTVLVSTQVAVTTDSAVYTVGASTAVKVTQASIANVSGSAVTVGVSIVKSGGTVGDGTHKILADTYSLAAGDTEPLGDLLVGHVLGDGDVIAMHCSAANAIDVVISGLVMQ